VNNHHESMKIYINVQTKGLQTFYGKGHTGYCGLVGRPRVEKVTVSGIANRLNYCVIFIVCLEIRMQDEVTV